MDVTESSLIQAFGQFGPIRIEWTGKDTSPSPPPPKGYVYIVFEEEENIPLPLSNVPTTMPMVVRGTTRSPAGG